MLFSIHPLTTISPFYIGNLIYSPIFGSFGCRLVNLKLSYHGVVIPVDSRIHRMSFARYNGAISLSYRANQLCRLAGRPEPCRLCCTSSYCCCYYRLANIGHFMPHISGRVFCLSALSSSPPSVNPPRLRPSSLFRLNATTAAATTSTSAATETSIAPAQNYSLRLAMGLSLTTCIFGASAPSC